MIPSNYSIPRQLFEVYVTNEENTEVASLDDEENKEGFTLHQGEITEIHYYTEFKDANYSYDYEDISSTGDLTIPYDFVDLDICYLGVRCLLRKNWEKYDETTNLKELEEALPGFITSQSFSDRMVKMGLSGMSKLLDKKYEFEFSQMRRSKIIEEVIRTSGLEPVVDPTGLDDQVIDFSNVTEGGEESSSNLEGVSGNIKSIAKKVIKGKKKALDKCKAIHSWCAANIRYSKYECSHYQTADECLKNKNHLNCADTARLTCALMRAAGLNAVVVHGPYHFWTIIKIDGKKYVSDQTSGSSGVEFDTYWLQGTGRINANGTGGKYDRECGINPSC